MLSWGLPVFFDCVKRDTAKTLAATVAIAGNFLTLSGIIACFIASCDDSSATSSRV